MLLAKLFINACWHGEDSEPKMMNKKYEPQGQTETCVTFHHDMSCKKGSTSNAWHARAMDHTQRMKFLCKKILRIADAFLGKEHVFPVSKKWTCENYNYNLATPIFLLLLSIVKLYYLYANPLAQHILPAQHAFRRKGISEYLRSETEFYVGNHFLPLY
jgi:hypothetical protein